MALYEIWLCKIPVLSLTYEERAYRLLGRSEKSDMILKTGDNTNEITKKTIY